LAAIWGFPSKGMLKADSDWVYRWWLAYSGAANRNWGAIVKNAELTRGNEASEKIHICVVFCDWLFAGYINLCLVFQ
jgi:hypothetical protein